MHNPFLLVAELHEALELPPLSEIPGCWIRHLDEHWVIAVNGHTTPVQEPGLPALPPYHMYVEFNGWPAGVLSLAEGTFAAGSRANIAEFCRAIAAATRRAQERRAAHA